MSKQTFTATKQFLTFFASFVLFFSCGYSNINGSSNSSSDNCCQKHSIKSENLLISSFGEPIYWDELNGELLNVHTLFEDERGFEFLSYRSPTKHGCPNGHYSAGLKGYCTVRDCPYYYQKHIKRLDY